MSSEPSFDSFELDPRVQVGVRNAGYRIPTPIQQETIAEAMRGRHVLGLAQTGTGKTAAFVLPILHHLVTNHLPGRKFVRVLVVAPTRELAEQIHDEFVRLGQGTGVRSATVYGGVGFQPQIDALRGRADVIVACPGRLLDHVERGNADLSLVETLVLDEADHMFDMGFLPAVRAIVRLLPQDGQRMLFSATMPAEVRHLADSVLTNPLVVEIGHSAPAETIDHVLIPVEETRKTELLLHLLRTQDHRSTLVFTRTKHRAKRLAATLDKANIFAAEIQGNLSQRRRQEALDGFKDGRYHVLVATDIAARGIDVARVSHVINYDFPDTPEAYTHRIGRTGRATRTGEALTFVTPSDFDNVRELERKLAKRVERQVIDDYGRAHAAELDDLRARTGQARSDAGRRPFGRADQGRRDAGRGDAGRRDGRRAGPGGGSWSGAHPSGPNRAPASSHARSEPRGPRAPGSASATTSNAAAQGRGEPFERSAPDRSGPSAQTPFRSAHNAQATGAGAGQGTQRKRRRRGPRRRSEAMSSE